MGGGGGSCLLSGTNWVAILYEFQARGKSSVSTLVSPGHCYSVKDKRANPTNLQSTALKNGQWTKK